MFFSLLAEWDTVTACAFRTPARLIKWSIPTNSNVVLEALFVETFGNGSTSTTTDCVVSQSTSLWMYEVSTDFTNPARVTSLL